jgi:hypothetical protein
LEDLLRRETVSKEVGTYQMVVLHCRFLDLLWGETETDDAVNAIIEKFLAPFLTTSSLTSQMAMLLA